jgi:hypothetical protein
MPKATHSIYLERDFRNILFSRAYENAGKSLRAIASEIGYKSAVAGNVPIRDMWLGIKKIPTSRIEGIAKLARISLSEILKHEVNKEDNQKIADRLEAFEQYRRNYKNRKMKKSHIFKEKE